MKSKILAFLENEFEIKFKYKWKNNKFCLKKLIIQEKLP